MVAFGALLIIAVLISLIVYFVSPSIIGNGEIITIIMILTIIVFAIYVIWDRAKNVSKGLPAKDERLVNINYKAGYYGFIAAIWTAVGAPTLMDIIFGYELEGHSITATVVIVSGLVFAISYLYLLRKGN